MSITERIREIRIAKGLKQSDLAKTLGIETSNYNRFENRGNKLTIEQVENIADALNVSIGELLGFENSSRLAELEETVAKLKSDNKRIKSNVSLLVLVLVFFNHLIENDLLIKNPDKEGNEDDLKEKISQAMKGVMENDSLTESDSK